MATQVQYRRGTSSQNDAFTGALGEITVDTTNWVLRIADGVTAGGFTLVGLNATQTLSNKVYNGTSVSVSGNITGGNLNTGAQVVATGNITGGNINTAGQVSAVGNVTGNYLLGNAYFVTGLSPTQIYNGNSNVTIASSAGNVAVNVNGSGIVAFTTGGVINNMGNGVGNIGNATSYFNTVFAKATSAQYADVAEKYVSDHAYPPGTVLEFGGDREVTVSAASHSTSVAGVVSTNPAYLMNAGATGDAVVEVALLGRVPCKVVGQINKGDRLVASPIPGVAQNLSADLYQPGCIIGKALENYNSDQVGTIEVVVGRL